MKNNLKEPCVECPFRKDSAAGWLGGETVQDTFQHVNNEGDFACHMTRHKAKKEMSRCRGSLLFLKKACKMPQFNPDLAQALKTIGSDVDKSYILSVPEFYKHHSIYD